MKHFKGPKNFSKTDFWLSSFHILSKNSLKHNRETQWGSEIWTSPGLGCKKEVDLQMIWIFKWYLNWTSPDLGCIFYLWDLTRHFWPVLEWHSITRHYCLVFQ